MIEDVSYYLGLSLCSICSIICIYIILTLFIKGYQSSMHNFFALNICFVYLILNTIDSIPKFDWIRIKREDSPSSPPPSLPEPGKEQDIPKEDLSPFCVILGTIRLPLKEFDYTLCLLLFIYTIRSFFFEILQLLYLQYLMLSVLPRSIIHHISCISI